jgi:hypothetical protein
MDILIWFLRFFSILLGLACMFVSIDMLYIWGLEGPVHRAQSGPRQVSGHMNHLSAPHQHNLMRDPVGGRKPGMRPSHNTWIWLEWQLRRPAFYLFLLGISLTIAGIFLWLPAYGNILWLSEHIEGINVLIIGLIFLRGTVKISSPLLWKKITIIKRPLSGRARPSLFWMAVGFGITLTGLYGITCDFTSPGACIGGHVSATFDLAFTFLEFILGGIAAVGLEDMLESYKENKSPELRSIQVFWGGLILFLGILLFKAMLISYLL